MMVQTALSLVEVDSIMISVDHFVWEKSHIEENMSNNEQGIVEALNNRIILKYGLRIKSWRGWRGHTEVGL